MLKVKAFVAGSGVGAFSDPSVVEKLLAMAAREEEWGRKIKVAYIGTATYDLPAPQQEQTTRLVQHGCDVRPVRLADPQTKHISRDDEEYVEKDADIILVSGGNTLFAVRRWEETGLDKALRAAAGRQAILAGGSAGAICWFTAGHSDSADPSTYPHAMMKAALGEELSEEEQPSTWSYIRVHGLGLLPGLVCPHFDRTQSNGVRRGTDFSRMMKRHPTERGLGLDHWAVLILNGDGTFEVFSPPGKTRESGDEAAAGTARPSLFLLDIKDGSLAVTEVRARVGEVTDILREPSGPLVSDPFERFCAMQNPTASSGALLRR